MWPSLVIRVTLGQPAPEGSKHAGTGHTCSSQHTHAPGCAASESGHGAHPGGHNLALRNHAGHHVAVGRPRHHVRAQQIPRAQVQQPKLLHQLGALQGSGPV